MNHQFTSPDNPKWMKEILTKMKDRKFQLYVLKPLNLCLMLRIIKIKKHRQMFNKMKDQMKINWWFLKSNKNLSSQEMKFILNKSLLSINKKKKRINFKKNTFKYLNPSSNLNQKLKNQKGIRSVQAQTKNIKNKLKITQVKGRCQIQFLLGLAKHPHKRKLHKNQKKTKRIPSLVASSHQYSRRNDWQTMITFEILGDILISQVPIKIKRWT